MSKSQRLLFLLSLFLIFLSDLIFLLNEEKKERIEKLFEAREKRIAFLNRDMVSLEKERSRLLFERDKILRELEEQKRKEKELARKKKLLELWSEKGLRPYRFGHRIFDDEKYLEINIDRNFADDFVLAPVTSGGSYASLLKKVFNNQ